MKDNGIRRKKVLLNPTLVLYFRNYESSNKIGNELSASFVLIVSVPRGNQSKSNITFGELSVLGCVPSYGNLLKNKI